MTTEASHLDVDPFDDAFLTNPYPFHEQIREAGPVVYLDRYAIYASARHAEVTRGLSDWRLFSSAAGVGLDDFRRDRRPAATKAQQHVAAIGEPADPFSPAMIVRRAIC